MMPQRSNAMASRSNMNRESASSIVTSRRTFRGRAGPTDGRLNKHQARRRRKQTPRDESNKTSKYGDEDDKEHVQVVEEKNQRENVEIEDLSGNEMEQENEAAAESASPADEEIKHLMRRVKNVRESIQLSAAANANPSTWQQNVLNPVRNCVGEWRSIVKHYQNELEASDCKAPALAVYGLIQMAVQSGPLAGAKPG